MVLQAACLLCALVLAGCADSASVDGVSKSDSALCAGVRLAVSPSSPASSGASVTLTASNATCGSGETAEYRFFYQNSGTKAVTTLGTWGASASKVWDTSGVASGSYNLYVYARHVGSSANYESFAIVGGYSIGNVCNTLTSFTASPPSSQSAGAAVSLTANATCSGGATAEYLFKYQAPGSSTFTSVGTWGGPTISWDTTALPSGAYVLIVYARAVGNPSNFEAYRYLIGQYNLGNACNTLTSFTASPASPQPVGTPLTLNARATCGTGATPEYLFKYQVPGSSTFTSIGTWGGSTISWDTSALPSGAYILIVYARAVGNLSNFEAHRYLNAQFNLGSACSTLTSFTASPTSPQPVGTVVALNASATCGGGATPEYLFKYQVPGSSTFTSIGTWGGPSVSWNTAALPSGAYVLIVYARAAGSSSSYESYRYGTSPYDLGTTCSGAALTVSPASPEPIGTALTLTGTATCASPELRFSYRAVGATAWTLLRSWGSGSATWDTSSLPSGQYSLLLEARSAGNLGGAETTTVVNYTLADVCNQVSVAVSPTSPQALGVPLTLTGTATCTGSATAEYQFQYQLVGDATFTAIRIWGSATANWNTTLLAAGTYTVRVQARRVGSTAPYESQGIAPYSLTTPPHPAEHKLLESGGVADRMFGQSLAANNNTLVISGGANPYSAPHVLTYSAGAWAEQGRLVPGDGNTGNGTFGASLAISGDTIVVGSRTDSSKGNNAGAAYVFVRSASVWSQQAKFYASDAAVEGQFGMAVSVDGDTAAIGSTSKAYIFTRSGGVWSQQPQLLPVEAPGNRRYGQAIAVSGNLVVVGAPPQTGVAPVVAGEAYVFAYNGAAWAEKALITANDGQPHDGFGWSVAVDAGSATAIVGAPQNSNSGGPGAAYVFVQNGGSWTQQTKLQASDPTSADNYFGNAVSIAADRVVVGAEFADAGKGAVYDYTRAAGVWTQQPKLTATGGVANDELGTSIALGTGFVASGAPNRGDQGSLSGAVYVFGLD